MCAATLALAGPTAAAQSPAVTSSAPLPRVSIDAALAADISRLDGTAVLDWTNTSAAARAEVCLALGQAGVPGATIAVTTVRQVLDGAPSSLDVRRARAGDVDLAVARLARPVARGATARLDVAWTAIVPRTLADLAPGGGVVVLTGWYPRVTDGPCGEAGSPQPLPADVEAHLTLPAGWTVAGRASPDIRVSGRSPTGDLALAVTAGREVWRARVDQAGADGSTADIAVVGKPGAGTEAGRILAAAGDAVSEYRDWLGALHTGRLAVVDVRWDSPLVGLSAPGLVVVASRWLSARGDVSLERDVIRAIGRQYWPAAGDTRAAGFASGIAAYTSTRAAHELLEGRHFATWRYFGGFVPYSVRAVLLSPSPSDPRPRLADVEALERPPGGAEADGTPRAGRAQLALLTLERYLGWSALQQALFTLRSRGWPAPPTARELGEVAGEARGRDLGWFVRAAFGSEAPFDYGIAALRTGPSGEDAGRFLTTVELRRFGSGVFAGTSEPMIDGFASAHALPVTVAFADGTSVREWWDGRQAEVSFDYVSRAPAETASVDPDVMLRLDEDRDNNTRRLAPRLRPAATRRLLDWIVWLQDLMLTGTALL